MYNIWTALSRCKAKLTFSIKLILVRNYLSCRIQMYLKCNFYSNATVPNSRFRYFTVNYLYFPFQGSRNTYVFFLVGLPGYESGFLINLLITAIWANNHLLPSFFASSSITCQCSILLWESQESLSSPSWLVKILRFGIFLKFNCLQVCYRTFQRQISST